MGSYSRLDRLEMRTASRVVSRLERLFRGRRWLRNTLLAILAVAVVAASPIESAIEGIALAAEDDELKKANSE